MSRTLPSPPTKTLLNTYRHCRHGIRDFPDKSHADGFLNYINSLTDDLQYTIEYPSHDGSLPYMDILINADKSTSVYRKHTHTNLYVHYNSCAPYPPKTVSSNPLQDELTPHILCSPNATLTKRTGHSLHNLLTKWAPP